jgi:hypothetical protein
MTRCCALHRAIEGPEAPDGFLEAAFLLRAVGPQKKVARLAT